MIPVIVIGLILSVLWFLFRVFKLMRKRALLKLEFKKFLNGWRFGLHMIAAAYIVIIAIQPMPWLVERFVSVSQLQTDTSARIATRAAPMVYAILVIIVFWWIVTKGMEPWWKYTKEEKELLATDWKNRWGKKPYWLQRIMKPSGIDVA